MRAEHNIGETNHEYAQETQEAIDCSPWPPRELQLPKLSEHLLDGLVEGPMSAMAVEDLIDAFGKTVIERAMVGSMNAYLGYQAGEDKPAGESGGHAGPRSSSRFTITSANASPPPHRTRLLCQHC